MPKIKLYDVLDIIANVLFVLIFIAPFILK
jgi:hypothetical protein